MVMASAAAVASSSRLALDMAMPVSSATMVWKLSSDSRLRGKWQESKMTAGLGVR